MWKSSRSIVAVVFAVAAAVATSACATSGYVYVASRPDARDLERRAYDEGYREGFEHGRRDALTRRDFRIERDRAYRNGGGRGNEAYRRLFRDGYRAGYAEGYERARADRNDRRDGPRGPGGRAPEPGGRDGRDGRDQSPAARVGYRDGLEAGREAASDREPFDPRLPRRYREGDHEYDRRYGSLEEYKQEYRAAFIRGYEEGYGARRR